MGDGRQRQNSSQKHGLTPGDSTRSHLQSHCPMHSLAPRRTSFMLIYAYPN